MKIFNRIANWWKSLFNRKQHNKEREDKFEEVKKELQEHFEKTNIRKSYTKDEARRKWFRSFGYKNSKMRHEHKP